MPPTKTKAKTTKATIIQQENALVPVQDTNMQALSSQVVNTIALAINSPRFDVKKMQAVLDMQMDVMRYQAEIAYNVAMNACQAELPHIEANKKNEHTKSKYADLDAIDRIIKPIYTKHGFSLSFDTRPAEGTSLEVICTVRHVQGHKETHRLHGALDDSGSKGTANKTGIQAAGSSTTYLQRYITKLIFNVVIVGEDKDGNRQGEPAKPAADKFTAPAADKAALENMLEALQYNMRRMKKKAQRVEEINKNLNLIHKLNAAGMEKEISELHALADQGE